ncbi:hypothetical protein BH20VER2_BH20VER2_12960 [soil metagenome]
MMKKLHVFLAGILVVGTLVGCGRPDGDVAGAPPEAQAPGEVTWLTDLPTAKAQAAESSKMVLINFTGSDWCPPCIMLKRQVFSHPEFAEYAERNLVLVEIDFPRGKAQPRELVMANAQLQQEFAIDGYPTIVVLDAAGKMLGQLGYMSGGPARFIGELEKLRAM